ncbi:hypothetical protein H072_2088 [Dactylellina haptotyla CBS 200.50]|uniref:Uncharacterized protein n=1 Tax=Dactylellina haptotyla (strain CBS 200.50) TaxID=1284197 RepID=S8ALQ2_DACHA|nr:hypothetical protein H072_2088 [Dactylellina haptotyla CBS 200.50]
MTRPRWLVFLLSHILINYHCSSFIDARVVPSLEVRDQELSASLHNEPYLQKRRSKPPKLSKSNEDFILYGGDPHIPQDEEPDPVWLSKINIDGAKTPDPGTQVSEAYKVSVDAGMRLKVAVSDAYAKNLEQVYKSKDILSAANNYKLEGDVEASFRGEYLATHALGADAMDLETAGLKRLYAAMTADNETTSGLRMSNDYSAMSIENAEGGNLPVYSFWASLSDGMLAVRRVRKYDDKPGSGDKKDVKKISFSDALYTSWLRYTTAVGMVDPPLGLNFVSILDVQDNETIEIILEAYKVAKLDPVDGDIKKLQESGRLPDAKNILRAGRASGDQKEQSIFEALIGTPLTMGITQFLVDHRDAMGHLEIDYVGVVYNTPTREFTLAVRVSLS